MGLDSEFAAAIHSGDAALVARLLTEHPSWKLKLDQPMPGGAFGATPLLAAVGRGSRELVDVLLQAGASPDARSDWWAGSFGVLDSESGLEDFLIESGATVDIHAAARLGRIDRLRDLLDRDPALVHARGGDGQTPLHFARNVEIAEFLLDRGAAIDALDIDHESTPAQYMVRDRREVARYLVSRGCRTDLLMASALGDLELVRRHLDASPESIRTTVSLECFPKHDPRAGGTIYIWTLGWFQTAHLAARENAALLELLTERSPASWKLAMTCELGDEAAARRLAPATTPASEDRYRLPAAAHNNQTLAVRLLLEAGWPVATPGQAGATALHWAAWHGNAEAVRILLEHGAPRDVTDPEYGGTPRNWAEHGVRNSWHRTRGNYPEVISLLAG